MAAAAPLMTNGGAMFAELYRRKPVVANYNVMGPVKAAEAMPARLNRTGLRESGCTRFRPAR